MVDSSSLSSYIEVHKTISFPEGNPEDPSVSELLFFSGVYQHAPSKAGQGGGHRTSLEKNLIHSHQGLAWRNNGDGFPLTVCFWGRTRGRDALPKLLLEFIGLMVFFKTLVNAQAEAVIKGLPFLGP